MVNRTASSQHYASESSKISPAVLIPTSFLFAEIYLLFKGSSIFVEEVYATNIADCTHCMNINTIQYIILPCIRTSILFRS